MAEQQTRRFHGPTRYTIVVRGELGPRFGSAFGAMKVCASGGRTYIVGDVVDQSQLHGILDRIRNLGIELISVQPTAEAKESPSAGEEAE
jgi:hypothetical protein